MSNLKPLYSTLRARPPTCASCSRTTTGTPRRVSSYAAVRPAGPAPMTTTGASDGDTNGWEVCWGEDNAVTAVQSERHGSATRAADHRLNSGAKQIGVNGAPSPERQKSAARENPAQ